MLKIDYKTIRMSHPPIYRVAIALLVAASLLILPFGFSPGHASTAHKSKGTVRIGTKKFDEAYVLGALYQLVLQKAGYKVTNTPLGETNVLQTALLHGDIDTYAEYTGTGFTDVLKHTYTGQSAKQMYKTVKREYSKRFKITWLANAPMSDSNWVALLPKTAKKYKIKSLKDVGKWSSKFKFIGFTSCASREDCLAGLKHKYNAKFRQITTVSSQPIIYSSLVDGSYQVAQVFTTDPQIAKYKLVLPKDPKHIFPAAQPTPLFKASFLKSHKDIAPKLNKMSKLVTTKAMIKMLTQMGSSHNALLVARSFLKKHHLI